MNLLKMGRFFRHSSGGRLIIARNEKESELLWSKKENNLLKLRHENIPGAAGIFVRNGRDERKTAASVVAFYGKGKNQELVEISFETAFDKGKIKVKPRKPEEGGFRLI